MSWTHDDDQIIIAQYERTIANLEQEAHQWKARYDELLRMYNERPAGPFGIQQRCPSRLGSLTWPTRTGRRHSLESP